MEYHDGISSGRNSDGTLDMIDIIMEDTDINHCTWFIGGP